MLSQSTVTAQWKDSLIDINNDIFDHEVIKPMVDTWIESRVYIPEATSVRPGLYSFDFMPFLREIANIFHPSSNTRFISIMKDGQSGFTTMIIACILWMIENDPDNMLFTAADLNLAAKTMEERFDPTIAASGMSHLLRSHVQKKTNNRTGDTVKKKEFFRGTITVAGTNSANTFRMFSAKRNINDDFDTAPKEIGKEGSPKAVMKQRQNSFGDRAQTWMLSTPTITHLSNIYREYLLGTQEKWNWRCPACESYFPVEWRVELPDGTFAGVVWQLDDKGKVIPDTLRYKTQCCGHLIEEKEKYELNLIAGKDPLAGWIATVPVPEERRHRSFQKNFIYNPPGFEGWLVGAEEWNAACPPGGTVDVLLLKAFNNLRLGIPFAETGASPRSIELMSNTRRYHPGIVPDLTCEADGNGRIIMITLACDINGHMKEDNEDVRLDWEIVAHSQTGTTYSIDHGSIGTHERTRSAGKVHADVERVKWTLRHGVKNSVWPVLEAIILDDYLPESKIEGLKIWNETEPNRREDSEKPRGLPINISAIDTGFGTNYAMQFIKNLQAKAVFIYGIKGRTEDNYRPLKRDVNPVKRSTEAPKELYIVEVDQMKDDLSERMKLRKGDDGSQPAGFMNFPEPRDGKYEYKSFFSQYEGERRTEVKNRAGTEVIGYKWEKKNNSTAQNHFWDVRIYNMAAPLVYLDLFRRAAGGNFKDYTYEDMVMYILG